MARCTPEERTVDPCWCDFLDCQADEANLTKCLRVYNDMYYRTKEISLEEALQGMRECGLIANDELNVCNQNLWRCRGSEGEPPRFSPDKKRAFGRASNAAWKGTAVIGFGAGVLAVGATVAGASLGPLAIAAMIVCFAGAGAGFAWIAADLSDLSIDPPDPDFDAISQPEPPTPPIILPNEELSAPMATALNAVLTNQAQSVGLGRAVVTAINKANTAEAANDLEARDRQLTASRGFATEWANVLEGAAPLRRNAARRFAHAFGRTPISKMEAIRLRSEILASGWPTPIRDMLAQYGISGQLQEEVLRTMRSRLGDLSALTISLADMIAARALNGPEKKVVAALREFAAQ
jgi:hypothetical protein